jgi:hypothetical protein
MQAAHTTRAINDSSRRSFSTCGASAPRRCAATPPALQKALEKRGQKAGRSAASSPGRWRAGRLLRDRDAGRTERLVVTVLMSDVRTRHRRTERPTVLAGQLNQHRAEINSAILDQAHVCSTWAM